MTKTMVMGLAALAFGVVACGEREPMGQRDDASVTAAVRKALADERVPGNVDVIARNGVVTLSGTVPDAQAKSRAEDVADDVDGVQSVNNSLRTTAAGDAPAAGAPTPPGATPPAGTPTPGARPGGAMPPAGTPAPGTDTNMPPR